VGSSDALLRWKKLREDQLQRNPPSWCVYVVSSWNWDQPLILHSYSIKEGEIWTMILIYDCLLGFFTDPTEEDTS
jgi:hypothetical protein